MISQQTIQQILGRLDIIDVVGEFVKLKKRGTNYLGLCPFHNEKTPSFTVSPAKELVERVLAQLSPSARLVITLLEIEERSIKEIAELTGWSLPLVKVRAFRARAEMKKVLEKIAREKYL